MARAKRSVNELFLRCAHDYLTADASAHELDPQGNQAGPLGLSKLPENSFFIGDADLAAALCHAAEDLALEEATGGLLAGFPSFAEFLPHRERYELLGLTLDWVTVTGRGRTPRAIHRVRFRAGKTAALAGFRFVLYDGGQLQALALCQQRQAAVAWDESSHLIFYTLNPGLVGRFRADFEQVLSGQSSRLQQFGRLLAIDQASRQIIQELSHQRQAMDLALRRLQLEGDRYGAGHFASALEREIARLSRWKTRLPQMLSQAGGNRS